jgi:hypothetical protein
VAGHPRAGVDAGHHQVKTLGPSDPDAGYQLTRRFYAGVGFQPVEEIHGLWPGSPCLIMIKYLS